MAQKWMLVFLSGEHKGKEIALSSEDTLRIGTNPNMDIVCAQDPLMAKFHLEFKNGHLITSGRSYVNSNRTYLNNKRVYDATLPEEGILCIGTTNIKIISNEKYRQYLSSLPARHSVTPKEALTVAMGILLFLLVMTIFYLWTISEDEHLEENISSRQSTRPDEAKKIATSQPLQASEIYNRIVDQYPLHPKTSQAKNLRSQLSIKVNQHLYRLFVKNMASYQDSTLPPMSRNMAWDQYVQTLSREKKKNLYIFWLDRIEKEIQKQNLQWAYDITIMLKSLAETPEEKEKVETLLLRIQNLLEK